MNKWIEHIGNESNQKLALLKKEPLFSQLVDYQLQIPQVFLGKEEIKLIVLGQDPTIQRSEGRKAIKVVLNLDRQGALRNYITNICQQLAINIENVYATNCIKNFFNQPPAEYDDPKIIKYFINYWHPILDTELARFPKMPIILLGQPALDAISSSSAIKCLRQYWGFTKNWKLGEEAPMSYLNSKQNILRRPLFPFPHVRSITKEFYKARFERYTMFMKDNKVK